MIPVMFEQDKTMFFLFQLQANMQRLLTLIVSRLLLAGIVVLNCSQVFCEVYPDISGYFKWSPDSHITGGELYCPDNCQKSNHRHNQECCACNAKRCWEIVNEEECDVTIAELHVENIGKPNAQLKDRQQSGINH